MIVLCYNSIVIEKRLTRSTYQAERDNPTQPTHAGRLLLYYSRPPAQNQYYNGGTNNV